MLVRHRPVQGSIDLSPRLESDDAHDNTDGMRGGLTANPWNLHDNLIDEISDHVTVTAAYTGTKWRRVIPSGRGSGMAFAMLVRTRPASYGEDDLAGLPLREIAALAKSWNPAEVGLGMAAVNAYHPLPRRAFGNGFSPRHGDNWARVFHLYREVIAGERVAAIGHFPFAALALADATELFIFERNPVEGNYPDLAAECLLSDCDYVFTTGSSFVNRMIPCPLELSRDAMTIMIDSLAPVSSTLSDFGVGIIMASASDQPGMLDESLQGKLLGGVYETGMRAEKALPQDAAVALGGRPIRGRLHPPGPFSESP